MGELSKAELDALVEEATVDAYNEDEQLSGFHVMLDEHLALPFQTTVLGVEVTVKDRPAPPNWGRAEPVGENRSLPGAVCFYAR
ncbi:calcium-binding protein [Streptosporangium sp. NPDC006013]|uniref:calcium-binding protein n=1 Tax=Streptosporangium sp. NPDC006013 TaxID=3155596 RepID=UPI0033B3C39C